jgi:hypothetical protein
MNIPVTPLPEAPVAMQDPLHARIRAEFLEMPGLILRPCQAARLFGVDQALCGAVLAEFVESGFLTLDDSQYRRVDCDVS